MIDSKKTVALIITGENRQLRRSIRESTGLVQSFGKRVTGVSNKLRNAFHTAGFGGISSGLRTGMAAIGGLAGVYGIREGILKAKEFEAKLGDLQIQGDKTSAWTGRARAKIMETASAFGVAKEEVLDYASALVEATGDADLALSAMSQMGKVAMATGANMASLSGIMAQFGQSMDIDTDQMYQAMNILRAQEKVGAMTFGAISRQGGRVFPMMTQFGKAGMGLRGVQVGGGLMQIAARGYGRGQEARVAVATQTFLKQLFVKRATVEKKLGVKVMGRDLEDVFRDIGKAMQDMTKATAATKIFAEGVSVAQQLGFAYRGGWKGGPTSAGGILSAGKKDVIDADFKARAAQHAHQWKKAMIKIDLALHKFFLPAMEKVAELLPSVGSGLEYVLTNFKELGILWGAWKVSGLMTAVLAASSAQAAAGGAGAVAGGVAAGGVAAGGVAAGGVAAGGVAAGGVAAGLSALILPIVTAFVASRLLWKAHVGDMHPMLRRVQGPLLGGLMGDTAADVRRAAETEEALEGTKATDIKVLRYMIGERSKTTETGAGLIEERKRLLPGLSAAWGGEYDLDFMSTLKKSGVKGMQKKLARLKALRGGITEYAQNISRKELGYAQTPKELRETVPSLSILDETIAKFRHAIDRLLQGKDIKVIAKVQVGPSSPDTRNADRSTTAKGTEAVGG